MQFILLLSVLCIFAESVKLPSNFIKCNRKDPDWRKCVFKAAVNAAPQFTKPFSELNIPNIDPFFIPEISISGTSGSVQVAQNYTNSLLYGLSKVQPADFGFDFDAKTIHLEGVFPEIRITGMYKFNGKILLLPVIGEGPALIELKNVTANMTVHYEENKRKGKTYIKVISGKLKLTPGLIYYKFDNLFNGDKRLGDNINQVMNENWRAVYEDVEEGYTELIVKIFINLINNFFSKLSIEEAFD